MVEIAVDPKNRRPRAQSKQSLTNSETWFGLLRYEVQTWGLPWRLSGQESSAGDTGLIPNPGRSHMLLSN